MTLTRQFFSPITTKFKQFPNQLPKTDLWERLLLLLIAVELTTRFTSPSFIRLRTSVVDLTGCIVASGRLKPLSPVQLRISNVCLVKKTD